MVQNFIVSPKPFCFLTVANFLLSAHSWLGCQFTNILCLYYSLQFEKHIGTQVSTSPAFLFKFMELSLKPCCPLEKIGSSMCTASMSKRELLFRYESLMQYHVMSKPNCDNCWVYMQTAGTPYKTLFQVKLLSILSCNNFSVYNQQYY